MLKDLLEAKKCFKLVCGAGNEDAAEVEKLVMLYAKAGCKFFDLSSPTFQPKGTEIIKGHKLTEIA